MADPDVHVQVPAYENLRVSQAAAVVQPPPPLQNQKESANPNPQNAAREEVTLEVFSVSSYSSIAHVFLHFVFPLRL